MTSERKIKANRANSRASTGPQTPHGRARAARNALSHGLNLSVCSDPVLSEQVEMFAREIAGADTNVELQNSARLIAEAQIDLCRVRQARHQLLIDALRNPYYDCRANMRAKIKLLSRLLRPNYRRSLWQPWRITSPRRCKPSTLFFLQNEPIPAPTATKIGLCQPLAALQTFDSVAARKWAKNNLSL